MSKYRNEDWLREKFHKEGLTQREIADLCDCSQKTIWNWMQKFEIKERGADTYKDEDWLREKYEEEGLSLDEMADLCDTSTTPIVEWMDRYDIERGDGGLSAEGLYTDKEWLVEQYIENGHKMKDMADKCGVALATIHYWMKKHGVERRDRTIDNPINEEELRELYVDQKLTYVEVGERLDCSRDKVKYWISQYDIPKRGRPTGELHHNYRGRVELECETCGDVFERGPWEVDESRFCSVDCYGEWLSTLTGPDAPRWNGGKTELVCEQCGDTYKIDPNEAERSRFCSVSCMNVWMSESFVGENSPMWNGGAVEYYGPNWRSQRRKCLERDGYQCVICGRGVDELGQEPDVHHIEPFKQYESSRLANRLSNLVTLCRSHHMSTEHGNIEIQEVLSSDG